MRTVRSKLVALVLACMVPAVIAAFYRANRAEAELLRSLTRRVDRVSESFAEEVDEYQSNAKVALSLVETSGHFGRSLLEHNVDRAQRMAQRLAAVYKYRVI